MADFSKFSPDNGVTTYDIKDVKARAGLPVETTKCKPEGSWWETYKFNLKNVIIYGEYIWTDGTNIYYSDASSHRVLDKSTSTWTTKTWTGLTIFRGNFIWTDGTDIYYSANNNSYVLDKSTSTWTVKTWTGLTNFEGRYIWTDGTDIYYSNNYYQYVLNKSTSTWKFKAWTGLTSFNGNMVWTDGTNIYYSNSSSQYVLDKSTSTWTVKTWTGLTSFNGSSIWTDGTDIYYSSGTTQYVLNKSTSTWTTKTWTGLTSFNGSSIWTDGTDIYYSNASYQYILRKIGSSSMDSYKNAITSLNTSVNTLTTSLTDISSNVGTLSSLTTTDKSSLVAAVNEVNSTVTNHTYKRYDNVTAADIGITTSELQFEDVIKAIGSTYGSGHYAVRFANNASLLNNVVIDNGMRLVDLSNTELTGYFADLTVSGNEAYGTWHEVGSSSSTAYDYGVYTYAIISYTYNNTVRLKAAYTKPYEKALGKLTQLNTTDKSSLVAAVNEVVAEVSTKCENHGMLYAVDLSLESGVAISAKTLIDAVVNTYGQGIYSINFRYAYSSTPRLLIDGTTSISLAGATIYGHFATIAANVYGTSDIIVIDEFGTLYSFNVVGGNGGVISTRCKVHNPNVIGTLSTLTTTDKSTAVSAINEVNSSKQPKTMSSAVTVGGVSQSTVEGAIGAINSFTSAKISDLYAILGTYGDDVYGLQVDYENYIYTRLAGAAGKSRAFFDTVAPWKDMKRCNLADDGTVNAYYGDADYIEDGSNGQVMVEIPKFYYKMVPLKLDPINDSVGGYHTRKANYYISATKYEGFKTFPAFVRPDGTERNKAYVSAYEGCIYDVSESAYILDDAQVGDFTASTGDKLSSIAGAKPCSSVTQNLSRTNGEQLALNRGTGWHTLDGKVISAVQWLFMIEYGTLNSQNAIGKGIVDKASGTGNEGEITGATANLGNASGMASGTDGLVSVSYRGIENFWGNLAQYIIGVNTIGDSTLNEWHIYICNDYNYSENKATENYEAVKFTLSKSSDYISAFGYDPDFDWFFAPSECTNASSNYPIGDYNWTYYTPNTHLPYRHGGSWTTTTKGGVFCSYLSGWEDQARKTSVRLFFA